MSSRLGIRLDISELNQSTAPMSSIKELVWNLDDFCQSFAPLRYRELLQVGKIIHL